MKFKTFFLATTVAIGTMAAPAFATTGGVSAAAGQFSSQFGSDAGVVGGALIAAAFIAVGFKWVKGMIFS